MSKINYTKLFIIICSACFLLWLFMMAKGDTLQRELFIDKCQIFISDFTNVILYSADRDPYGSDLNGAGEHAYLPLAYIITYCFSAFSDPAAGHTMWKNPQLMVCILIFFSFFTGVLFVQLYDIKKGSKAERFLTASLMILSGVYMFSLERGNLILLALILTICFLQGYQSRNPLIRELSFLALACAAALKIFPALFGILLIYEKRFKDAIRLILYGIAVCILPFLFFRGGFSNIPTFIYNVDRNLLKYNHSNFGIDRLLMDYPHLIREFGKMLARILAFLLLFIAPFWKKWKTILALVLVMIVLPSHSELYNLLFMFPVWILFLNDTEHESTDIFYFVCSLFMFIPLSSSNGSILSLARYPMVLMYLFLGVQSAVYMVKHKQEVFAFYRTLIQKQPR